MLPLNTLRTHWQLLVFGWLMSFCSSFGQTYFISIFGGVIRAEFGLGHGAFGTCYAAGTLASACVLLWAGRLIDSRSLTQFSVTTAIGLAAATALMAGAAGPISLGLAFFALRFFGQGLMTHAAMTAMGRYFSAQRGRAVSFAALGHVTGEAVLPLAAVALMSIVPWRGVWLSGGAMLILGTAPLIVFLLSRVRLVPIDNGQSQVARRRAPGNKPPRADATLADALRERGLYFRLPVLLAPAFISTGLIFHQVHIGAQKGWRLTLIASSLSVFALGSFVAMLAAGPLVDRLSAQRLVPVSLSPLALACIVLATSQSTLGALAYFGLLGFGSGLTSIIVGAIWAELYGITHLGAIRAFGAASMVFSSGLAPAVMGLFIDRQWSVGAIAMSCALYCLVASVLAAAAPERRVR